MSDIKEVDIRFKMGDFNASNPGVRGTFTLVTGPASANQVWAELQGRYGEDYSSKPVVVLGSDDAESLKTFLENFDGFCVDTEEEKAKFLEDKANLLKPTFKRVGDEVVISREEPIAELEPFIGGFQDVLDGNCSFEFTLECNKTPAQMHAEKNNIIYGMHNGYQGRVDLKLSLAFLERAFDMGTQFAPVPEPELAKSMLNFFKKYSLNFETYDVTSLPQELRDVFKHPMFEQLNPFTPEIVGALKEKVLPVLQQFEALSSVSGPLRVYYPIKDTLAIKLEMNAVDWFNQFVALLSE
uniref:Uncharacterized protein n=1 Tax=Euplotes harpa TaxID=151035 RepID=A0A7S3N4W8_9SPIT